MGNTSIEWCDKVWNPATGCTKVSAGCKHCYAERVFPRLYSRQKVICEAVPGGNGVITRPREFSDVRCHPERLDAPLRWKKPCRVFVNSMSDLFHESVPDKFIGKVMGIICSAPQHDFLVLTKRPERMLSFMREWGKAVERNGGMRLCPFDAIPINLWLGVSAEDQKTADERIPLLLQTPAAIRFVSYEPALGPVDFRLSEVSGECGYYCTEEHGHVDHWRLDWVIAGGESGPNARPAHPDWFRSVRDQCQMAGVPFFFKQWGMWGDHAAWLRYCEGRQLKSYDWEYGQLHRWPDNSQSWKVGKKATGRLLDGREWNEFPKGRMAR